MVDRLWQEIRSLRNLVLAGLFAGIITVVFGIAAYQVINDEKVSFSELYCRWDTIHYEAIATGGYAASPEQAYRICFFPLFPFLAAPFVPLVGDATVALVFVANLACIAACVVLHRLAKLEFDREIADTSVLVILVFPTAYFLHVGYTESLFLATSLAAFLSARRGAWMQAGLWAFFATLTRMSGLALLPALLVEYAQQCDFRISRFRWKGLFALAPLLGLAGYMLLNLVVFGDPVKFLELQATHFRRTLDWPWVGLSGDIQGLVTAGPSVKIVITDSNILVFLLATATVVWSAFRLRPCYTVYAAALWLLTFCYGFWMSLPRHVLVIFPMFFLLAVMVRGKPMLRFGLGFASVLLYALAFQQFVRGYWSQ